MNIRDCLKVYLIMGSNNSDRDPLLVLEQALKGGISLFQFREKGKGAKTGEEKLKLALEMKRLCRKYGVPFFVNDDVALAIEVEADGIHVGQNDEHITSIRERCPAHLIIGVSATNKAEAIQAVKDGADYIGIGPLFTTNSKHDAKTPIGLAGLAEIVERIAGVPTVAIGGIKAEDVQGVIKSGADGISVISAITQAEFPDQAAGNLMSLVEKAVIKN